MNTQPRMGSAGPDEEGRVLGSKLREAREYIGLRV